MELFSNTFLPGFPARFATLCRLRGVQDVALVPGARAEERVVLDSLGWPRDKVDDVVIYTVPRP